MEIGSEYSLRLESLNETGSNIFNLLSNCNSLLLNNGRSAIKILDDYLGDGEILIPEFICDCICNSIERNEIIYYKLDEALNIDLNDLKEKVSDKTNAILVMNYFGHLQPAHIVEVITDIKSSFNLTIIEDTTHSVFSKPITVGDIAICSLRKWVSIPDGGVLYSKHNLELFDKTDIIKNTNIYKAYGMILKTLYLDGVLDCNETYRRIFANYEDSFDVQAEPMLISDFSRALLKCFNIDSLITARKNNYNTLYEFFKKKNIDPVCEIKSDECPLSFPIKVKNRDEFRQYLIAKNIFCAVHWPIRNTVLENNSYAVKLSDEIISLPIDQRYGNKEMEYLISIIEAYDGEL